MSKITKEQEKEINEKVVEVIKAELLKAGIPEKEINESLANTSSSTCTPLGHGGTCVVGV